MKSRRLALALLAALALSLTCLPAQAQRDAGRDKWQQPDRVVADLALKEGSAVADVGAGRGYFTFRFAKAVGKTGKVFATDIDAKAMKAVEDQAKRDGVANVQAVVSEATRTKLDANSVDVAFICDVLHHVPKDNRPALVKDIARAIKPGGFFFICDWRMDAKINCDKDNRIPRDEFVKLASDAGLTLDADFHYLENQVFLRFRKPKP